MSALWAIISVWAVDNSDKGNDDDDGAEVRDMAYHITLTDDEYERLSAAASQQGKTIEELVRAALTTQLAQPPANKPAMTEREFEEHLYRKGIIDHIPDHRPDTPEEEAELDEIARRIRPGKMASDIVIEDRGPR